MKKTIIIATGALVAAGFAVDAKAVDVELYGQVNKSVVSADNGVDNTVTINDNDKSSTRIGLKGEQALDNGLTASVLVEYELNQNSTHNNLANSSTQSASTLVERHTRVGLAGDFGAVFIGRTSSATDGISEIDMAGVSNIMGSQIRKTSGGSTLFQKADGTASTIKVENVNFNFDGDRINGVVYHSPVVTGFQIQASTSDGGDIQTAVRYSGKFDSFAVKGGLGVDFDNDGSNANSGIIVTTDNTLDSVLSGSFSVKHDSGLSGTVSFGKESRSSGAEASSVYTKLGYAWDAFEVAVDYSKYDSDRTDKRKGTTYGLGAQYNLGQGVSLAAGYRNLSAEDNSAIIYQDIDIATANLRIKF